MTCYTPLAALQGPYKHVKTGKPVITILGGRTRLAALDKLPKEFIEIPCGQCIGCRLSYSVGWAIRAMHEASRWKNNSFLTLTYNQENLPADGSLVLEHYQLFMKKLRIRRLREPQRFLTELTHRDYKEEGAAPIRFYHCGEYGEQFERPHYHSLVFNLDFNDKELLSENRGNPIYKSEILTELWGMGFASIGEVTYESAAYVARYILKKQNGKGKADHYKIMDEIGIERDLAPEYTTMSRFPGIGAKWFDEFGDEIYPDDFILVKSAKGVLTKKKPPRYYDLRADTTDPELIEEVRELRQKFAENHGEDNTSERLETRERVKKVQLDKCKRNYEKGEEDET